MNGSQIIVEMLQQYGVNVIFGVPGDTSIPLYEALHDKGGAIRHVMARDERSASFMADAYARLSHKPGVCECPSGAGPLYALPGIAEANASSIPVILITSDIPLSGEGKKTITELDCQRLFAPVTKWSSQIKQVDKLPETIRRVFRIATTGRPGAIHLAIPQEVLTGVYTGSPKDLYAEADCCSYPAYRTRGSRKSLETLTGHLEKAQRPVIIAGGGTKHSQAGDEILQLAKMLNAPVVTTISGQGILADHHEMALGVIGDNGFHPHAHQAVEQGDVLLYIGCKMGSVSTINWQMPSPQQEQIILQIDLDPELLANNYRNTHSVAGDAKLVLQDLIALLKINHFKANQTFWIDELNRSRRQFWSASEAVLHSTTVPLKPQRVVHALNQRISANAVIIADAGTPTPHISRYLRLQGRNATFIIPRAYGGLGYAVPALVGAHFARPDAQLVGLFGDGSLGMSAGEIETLARLKIPAVLMHFNNGCFGWIKALQALHAKEKFYSVDFCPTDPAKVAEGFGVKALRIQTADELEAGLDMAFAMETPVFLDIVSESEVSELPPVFTWQKAAEKNKKPIVHT
ncbi:thiamine pyrophosphate-binding protein [Desulfosarcina sp.]|uniref:thiamine pyrophosphate-binding protein n=1 Tax=Desulfosarcina sp. TaxID=2027861 RepID=UPI003970CB0D